MKAALGSLVVVFLGLLLVAYGPAAADARPVSQAATPEAARLALALRPAIATPVPQARGDAYLYGGPGMSYARRGSVRAGASLRIIARNSARTWFQLADGRWIAATLVRNPPAVPIARNIPPAPTATRRPPTVSRFTPELPRPPLPTPERPPITLPGEIVEDMPTPTPKIVLMGHAAANANLRAGPGMGYRVVAWALTGEELQVIGSSPGGAWSQLANGLWIATYLVEFDQTPGQ